MIEMNGMNNLENIKQVIADFEKSPKGVQNCGTMAEYAAEALPWLIAEIEWLRAENKRLSEQVDDLKMDIGFLRDSI